MSGRTVWVVVLLGVMGADLLVPCLLAPFVPGYSHRGMVMSVLGGPGSPVRRLYSGWLVVGGVLFLLGTVQLCRALRALSRPLAMAALLLMLGYALGGMVLAGLFPAGEDKEARSLSARVHGAGSALGFLALLGAGIPLALLHVRAGRAGDGAVCLALFALGLAAFVLFVMADKDAFRGSWIDREGTWQRLSLLLFYATPAWTALRLVLL